MVADKLWSLITSPAPDSLTANELATKKPRRHQPARHQAKSTPQQTQRWFSCSNEFCFTFLYENYDVVGEVICSVV